MTLARKNRRPQGGGHAGDTLAEVEVAQEVRQRVVPGENHVGLTEIPGRWLAHVGDADGEAGANASRFAFRPRDRHRTEIGGRDAVTESGKADRLGADTAGTVPNGVRPRTQLGDNPAIDRGGLSRHRRLSSA